MNIAFDIQKFRKRLNLAQAEVANKLGLSRQTYAHVEKGERELTISEASKLARILDVDMNFFIAENKSGKSDIIKKNDFKMSVPENKLGKFQEALLYILEKIGAKPNVGEAVIYKIMYFIDFDYYEKFEEKLIGATYIKNHYGPTPTEFTKIVTGMEMSGDIEKIRSKYFQYEQKKYFPIRKPDLSKFSAQEIKHIDDVLDKLSDKNANELKDYSHKDVPWITTEDGKEIDYESVFYRTPEMSVRNYGD